VPGRASADLALPSTPCANRSRASAGSAIDRAFLRIEGDLWRRFEG